MNKPKALLIHDFEGSNDGNWFPWLEKKLSNLEFEVVNETLPNPEHPVYTESLKFLEEKTKNFGDNDIVIGHSLGAFWAVKLAEKKHFKSVILVAPAIGELPFELMRKEWDGSDINALEGVIWKGCNPQLVKADKKVAFFSNDDQWIPLELKKLLNESWEIVDLHAREHITDEEFPELLEILKK